MNKSLSSIQNDEFNVNHAKHVINKINVSAEFTSCSSSEKFDLASESTLVILAFSFISSLMSSDKTTKLINIVRNEDSILTQIHTVSLPYSTNSEKRTQMFSTTSSLVFMLLDKQQNKPVLVMCQYVSTMLQ